MSPADATVRPLAIGEEAAWVALAAPPDAAARELADLVARRTGPHAEAAHCALVVVREGQIVGRLRGFEPDHATYVASSVAVRDGYDAAAVIAAMLAYALRSIRGRRVEAVSWRRPDQDAWHAALLAAGFALHMEKTYVRRALVGYRSSYADALAYRSLADVGEGAFIAALELACEGSVDRAVHPGDAAGDFAAYREYAGAAFDPTQWLVAHEGRELVGVVCPQRFHDVPDEGSVFALGVAPGVRGRGFGRVLRARGLDALARSGATDYVGSTDVLNAAMERVFAANGCLATGVRRYYRAGP